VKVTPISSTTALSLYPNIIYKQPIPAAIHRINPPVTFPNLYLIPTLYLINTTYKNKATTNTL